MITATLQYQRLLASRFATLERVKQRSLRRCPVEPLFATPTRTRIYFSSSAQVLTSSFPARASASGMIAPNRSLAPFSLARICKFSTYTYLVTGLSSSSLNPSNSSTLQRVSLAKKLLLSMRSERLNQGSLRAR